MESISERLLRILYRQIIFKTSLDINTDYKNSCKTSGQGKRLSEMWEKRFLDSDKIRKEISDVREMKKMRNKIGNKMNFKRKQCSNGVRQNLEIRKRKIFVLKMILRKCF
ncbi:uncharacterized protein LOC144474726 isoform X2 [Augochlora pura]